MQRKMIAKSPDDFIRPGTWVGKKIPDYLTALIGCPKCGDAASLSQHIIAQDGLVTPSVVCPNGCGFHEYVRLGDWE